MKTAVSDLLAQAKAAYERARGQYRDSLLECGRLLHEYILAYLAEGDGERSNRRRRRNGWTRKQAVALAAEAFGISDRRISYILRGAMAAILLGGKKGIGSLGFSSLFYFSLLVRRRPLEYGEKHHEMTEPISASEQWEIDPAFADKAKLLFGQAVKEEWGRPRVLKECRVLRPVRPHPKWEQQRRRRGRQSVSAGAAREACGAPGRERYEMPLSAMSTGDLAEEILDMVRRSSDPWAVSQRLIPYLQKISRKEPASVC